MAEEIVTVAPDTDKVEECAAPSTSDKTEGEDVDCEAKKLMGAGHRHLVMKDVKSAVTAFQEASSLLAKKYGDTADECADAFFSYGISLLELARMENGVLGNALEGMPEEEEEEDAEKEDPNIPSAADLDEKERDQLREQVYDAMAEEKTSNEKSETEEKGGDVKTVAKENECKTQEKEGSSKTDIDMEVAEKPSDKAAEKGDSAKKTEEPKEGVSENEASKAESKDEAMEDASKEAESKDEASKEAESKDEASKEAESKDEASKEAESKDEASKEAESKDEAVDTTTKEKGEEPKLKTSVVEADSTEDKAEEKPDAKKETKEEKTEVETEDSSKKGNSDHEEESEEQMEGEEDEGEDSEENEGTEEKVNITDEDDVGNLQLAWEMLDLSKIIFKRKETKEAQLKAAQAHLKLGEVSVESENYTQAVEDFMACWNIQKLHLEAHDRLLAETHYQLGLAYQYSSKHEDAISHFSQSVEVIEKRMALLTAQIEKASGDSEPESPKEMEELKGLLPDIREKIEDSKEAQKSAPATEIALKETLAGGSSGFTQENGSPFVAPVEKSSGDCAVPVTNCISDISHLVRKKRKPEEESPIKDSEAKKPKQDLVENGDAVVPTNEEADKAEEKSIPMETAAVESSA
ncbi:LOW QUALITY PROTEIN: nuclear autoantigenic sperm protein [Pelodytes ibericus]